MTIFEDSKKSFGIDELQGEQQAMLSSCFLQCVQQYHNSHTHSFAFFVFYYSSKFSLSLSLKGRLCNIIRYKYVRIKINEIYTTFSFLVCLLLSLVSSYLYDVTYRSSLICSHDVHHSTSVNCAPEFPAST